MRIMSCHPPPSERDPEVEWAQADLETGVGLREAVAGAEVIVHAASAFRRTESIDVRGSQRLLEKARAAGASHFLYVSIVGIDRIPMGYYRHKLAVEALVEQGSLPWSILRSTQFHTLIDGMLRLLLRLPIALLPADFRFQPIDPAEVADRLSDCVASGPAGRLPDIGGPEVHFLGDLARLWMQARGIRRWLIHLPLLGTVAAGFRQGFNTVPDHRYGQVTWADWLRREYQQP